MCLHYSHLAPNGTVESHRLHDTTIEVQMDVLNGYHAYGYVLLLAFLINEAGERIFLPIEVFDGEPIGVQMLKLQQEYNSVLSS